MGLATQILALVVLAGGDPPTPRVEITPILHQGDPAPGIPGATMAWIGRPQIDAEGNVLFWAIFESDGGGGGTGLWYGGAGTLEPVAYSGMQPPDLPQGVVYENISSGSWLAENGWMGIPAYLTGPGIVPGVNDKANFVGPSGDVRKVLQGGEAAPGLEAGTVIDVSSGLGLAAYLSDNATLLVIAWLSGPMVNPSNDQAIWIGTRDALDLIWRKGMQAPGTGGTRFAWADGVKFNDAAQIAFRGGLVREGDVDHTNDKGIWAGPVGDLQALARTGDPAPGTAAFFSGLNRPSFNTHGDASFSGLLAGKGLGSENDLGLWLSTADGIQLVGREGDPVPILGPDVELAAIGSPQISAREDIFYVVKYRGDPIDDSNAWAMRFGPFDEPQETLRDGNPAAHFPDDTLLAFVAIAPGIAAMNDLGDIVTGTEITGPGVTGENKVVVWFYDRVRAEWYPLLRSGTMVEQQIVSIPGAADLSTGYFNKTGGSDGERQSFNDAGQLGIKLEFADGTHGNFVLRPSWAGDGDGDADVDFVDFGMLQTCFAGPDVLPPPGCDSFDFDRDQDVDLLDYEQFLEAITDPQ